MSCHFLYSIQTLVVVVVVVAVVAAVVVVVVAVAAAAAPAYNYPRKSMELGSFSTK
jgi:hypothetical protein